MKKNSRRHVPQPRRIVLDYSEKWGKDVGEATKLALADLKISENEAVVTVLEQPTKGFLGIGAKLAKVRVEKKEQTEGETAADDVYSSQDAEDTAAAEDADDAEKLSIGKVRDLRKNKSDAAVSGAGGSGRGFGDRASGSRRSGSERRDRSERREKSDGRGDRKERERGGERGERQGRGDESRSENKGESRAYWLSSNASDKRRRSERTDYFDFNKSAKPAEYAERPESAGDKKFSLNDKPDDLRPVSEGNAAENFFREVTGKMGINIDIHAFENDDCVYIEVEGKDSRTVIGKRGQTLDAIQYLTNLVMNKTKDKYIRVIVDVEGYRSRREKTLEQLAFKLSRKVERTGRSVRLEPMNPYERKVIHATLQSNGKVSTRSEGEEPYRRVIIERK
ncbi:MAG: protein jag [Clostridiales Family XIII bacterium]|jgi:spoIIIJ-associated protein|nr:protein jag [Clostridiales Family XIII bacterium]